LHLDRRIINMSSDTARALCGVNGPVEHNWLPKVLGFAGRMKAGEWVASPDKPGDAITIVRETDSEMVEVGRHYLASNGNHRLAAIALSDNLTVAVEIFAPVAFFDLLDTITNGDSDAEHQQAPASPAPTTTA
jgi:hypothetical protein